MLTLVVALVVGYLPLNVSTRCISVNALITNASVSSSSLSTNLFSFSPLSVSSAVLTAAFRSPITIVVARGSDFANLLLASWIHWRSFIVSASSFSALFSAWNPIICILLCAPSVLLLIITSRIRPLSSFLSGLYALCFVGSFAHCGPRIITIPPPMVLSSLFSVATAYPCSLIVFFRVTVFTLDPCPGSVATIMSILNLCICIIVSIMFSFDP